MKRRQFLVGAGALGAAGMLSRLARSEPRVAPLRLLLVHKPTGTSPEHYDCAGDGTAFTPSPILEPFADVRDQMVVVDGLENRKQGNTPGEDHVNGMVTFLTGGIPFRPAGSSVPLAARASIDQVLAANPRFVGATPIRSLQLTADDRGHQFLLRVLSSGGYGIPMPPEEDPLAAFARVFGTLASGSQAVRERTQSVLDFARADLARLDTQLGHAERARIDRHLTAIREAERVLHQTTIDPEPVYRHMADASAMLARGRDGAHGAVGRAHFELVRVAFQCDLTRIACFTWGSFQQNVAALLPGLASRGYHDVSHAGPDAELAMIHRWYNEQLAHLLRRLRATPDVDGRTLLDNTLVVAWTEMRHGSHTFDNTPIQLFGGAAGRLAGGRLVRYPGYSTNDLWRTLLNSLGDHREHFGDHDKCSGTLSGLFADSPLDGFTRESDKASRSPSLAP